MRRWSVPTRAACGDQAFALITGRFAGSGPDSTSPSVGGAGADHRLRSLPAVAGLLSAHRTREAPGVPRRHLLGEARSWVRRSTGAAADSRAGASGARRQSNRAGLHRRRRRRLRRFPDGITSPRGLREHSDVAASRRRIETERRLSSRRSSAARLQTTNRRQRKLKTAGCTSRRSWPSSREFA